MKQLAGIVAFLALTGCTIERTVVEQTPTTTEAPTTQPPATAPVQRADESAFFAFIESEVGSVSGLEDTMLETGYMVCDLAENGTTMEEFAEIVIESATDAEGAYFLNTVTASALAFLCPWAMDI